MAIAVEWGVATDRGAVRASNQDSVLAVPPVFAVADGMGGYAGGEVASALAVEVLGGFSGSSVVDPAAVLSAIRAANGAIFDRARADEKLKNMGTTVTGLALTRDPGNDNAVLVFNVGDSRTYALVDGRLTQLSSDHSVVNEMVLSGQLTKEQAQSHPARNVITRALGIAADVEIDAWLQAAVPGQTYLLCSDGLVNEVPLQELERELASDTDPQRVADAMVAEAVGRGARDNVSVIVVRLAETDARRPDELDDPDSETAPGAGRTEGLLSVPPPSAPDHSALRRRDNVVIDAVPEPLRETAPARRDGEVIDVVPQFLSRGEA